MKKGKPCQHLDFSGEYCKIIKEELKEDIKCYRADKVECRYSASYWQHFSQPVPPLSPKIKVSREIIDNLKQPFLKNWKALPGKNHNNDKSVLSAPFEDIVRKTLKKYLKIDIVKENYPIYKGCIINADAIARKEGKPTCIFSIKTWIGLEQIRETFAYAYLAKKWKKEEILVYEIGLIKTERKKTDTITILADACKPSLDGVFYLTEPPYIDELIEKLKDIYSK